MAKNAIKQDEFLKHRSKFEIIMRLANYMKPFKLSVFTITVFMIFVMAINLLNPYLLKVAIDKYIKANDIYGLLKIGMIMIGLNFFALIISKLRVTMMGKMTNRIVVNIRRELYSHIQKLSFSFFDDRPVGKILARVIGDVKSLEQFFSNSVKQFIPEILRIVFVTIIMFSMNFKLALVSISILPLLFIGLFTIEILSRKRWDLFRKKKSNLNAYTHENFSGIRVVQSFVAEEKAINSYNNFVDEMTNSFIKAVKLQDLFWGMVQLSWGLGMVIVYFYSVKMIDEKSITIGTLVAFTWYISMFWRPIMNIANFYNTLVTSFSAADRIFEILEIEPNIKDYSTNKMKKINGEVEFKNVSFEYETGIPVLHKVNFKVNAGEVIALVGPTGAGKTTIINLLSRFYDVTSGKILVDGVDIKTVELESFRSQMGIMLQDTFLFSESIKENIKYGKLNATDEEIIKVAKIVGIHDYIMSLEKGYDTNVNERGTRLSVGQRQLISLARALLADPKILILDEATSNIDTHTEKLVQEGIKKLLKNRTSFVIAHRLSTIRDADRIMYIDKGKIVESGTHDELIEKRGYYYNLYMSQFEFIAKGV
ncbi:multidrug ABC transporter ATP-binding protein [Tepiditoga spiralis]|uniref:Multidrug ABC transporter ATP-binding protein n=1 Tax=Tepiditoga spiralis TaxID=2108365 RepID=A0A7G1GC85_9BACT|nr:ABC transporter ATP-binding protein [Tepiditoga spiralis]BBE31919.1 multidrug ABC transporter ATP-binding protein [Tepiditoga spiralis]